MPDAERENTLAALPTPPWLEGRGGRPARYCERQLIDAVPTPPWLEGRGGRPARYCERQLIDAVRHVDDSDCKWRRPPADLPPRSAVYAYFQRTTENGAVAEYHDRLRSRPGLRIPRR